jgi:chorismate-pyruvate lyase
MSPESANPPSTGRDPRVDRSDASAWSRAAFLDAAAGGIEHEQALALLRLFIAQDGSTTRLCEAIAGGPLSLRVRQQVCTAVPPIVRSQLPGTSFLERYSTLAARGQVMMDNLVYVPLDGLGPSVRSGLESGTVPIGHLLDAMWVRRAPLPADAVGELREQLWREVGTPDPLATRAYVIRTPEGPRFLIVETFRRGMRMRVAPEPGP